MDGRNTPAIGLNSNHSSAAAALPGMDHQTDELGRKRRQDEVAKARVMLEGVSDRERREMIAMFPELRQSKSAEQRLNYFDARDEDEDVLPKAYVFMGPELVETQIGGGDYDIDLGLNGCKITVRDFVGMRPIESFSKMPALPSTFTRTKAPSTASKLATSLSGSLKGTWQWIADKKPLGLSLAAQQKPPQPTQPPIVPPPRPAPAGSSNGGHFQAAVFLAAAAAERDAAVAKDRTPASEAPPAEAEEPVRVEERPANGLAEEAQNGESNGDKGMAKFEIVWKDHTVLGVPVRRLEFGCNAAGLAAIKEKVASWQELATSPAAMLEASQAALKACGGVFQENPGVWLPSGMPEAAMVALNIQPSQDESKDTVYLDAMSSDEQGPASQAGDGNRRAGENGHGHAPEGEPEGEEAVVAAAIRDGETSIRWGSVKVVGKFMPKRTGHSLILRPGHFMAMSAAIPSRLRMASWTLLYSTARDGISLATLYRKVAAQKGPCVLFIRDSQRYVFGCFCNEEWKPSAKYYGNGECFVFQVQPELQAFRWTHSNSYFMFSTPTSLAIGGGDHYAFSLNSDLLTGYSAQCETFGSLPLAGSEEFQAVLVEVWGLR